MAKDVNCHCQACKKHQQSKWPSPQHAPMVNIPNGCPWQMIVANILEVPISTKDNRCLLVVQGYLQSGQKPFPYQIKGQSTVTNGLIKVFSRLGIPGSLHSGQRRNFESTVLAQILNAFGLTKSHTTAYHPECDGVVAWFNITLLQLLCSTGSNICLLLYAYRTSVHFSTVVSLFICLAVCSNSWKIGPTMERGLGHSSLLSVLR